ncbi:unnamed protein product [Rotaria sp. Silwood2]|nr:unnamed protein product [Rotaria sp. Silwood2]CAF4251795.1 unnamed protein product [Rotaria sp. Silwood2]
MAICSGLKGIMDQLSISYEAKTNDRILWDAAVVRYYSFDDNSRNWLLDYDSNYQNATSENTQVVISLVRNALNFTVIGAYYQATGFTVLDISYHAFTVAL